jgi:TonB family protein
MPLRFITTLVVSSLGLLTWGATYVGAQSSLSTTTAQVVQPIKIYEPGNGVSNPFPLHQSFPSYPVDAAASSQQGEVWLRVVVLPNGTVGDVQVVKSLDQSTLDAEAVRAAKLWLFRPATRNSQPVAVYTTLILTFRPPAGEGAQVPQAFADAYPTTTPGLVAPRVLASSDPKYSSDAMRQKLQGEVVLEAVIGKDGALIGTRVVKSLDPDLDGQAELAVKSWTFAPAMLNGQAVLARMPLILTFRLH